jgi:hypothetical protein
MLVANSDKNTYTLEGTLQVTINNAQGNSIGSGFYDLSMNLNKAGLEKSNDVTTQDLQGTMTSTDQSNPGAKTEYAVDGTLEMQPNIEYKELKGSVEVGPITLNLRAIEK